MPNRNSHLTMSPWERNGQGSPRDTQPNRPALALAHDPLVLPPNRAPRETPRSAAKPEPAVQPLSPTELAQEVKKFDEGFFPAVLFATLKPNVGDGFSPTTYHAYVQEQLSQAGSPSDPIERSLIEQILLARHFASQLACRSANADAAKEATLFAEASARVQAEMRRMSIALKDYRQSAGGRSLSVVYGDEQSNGKSAKTSAG